MRTEEVVTDTLSTTCDHRGSTKKLERAAANGLSSSLARRWAVTFIERRAASRAYPGWGERPAAQPLARLDIINHNSTR
eukprot:scaffold64581_cov69-Phaeocystis_antarctica.AAC.3